MPAALAINKQVHFKFGCTYELSYADMEESCVWRESMWMHVSWKMLTVRASFWR